MKEDMPMNYIVCQNNGYVFETHFCGLVCEIFKQERNPPKINDFNDRAKKYKIRFS